MVAYFRGRKLQATRVKIPQGYQGMVAKSSPPTGEDDERQTGRPQVVDVDADSDAADGATFGAIEAMGAFDEVLIWDQTAVGDASTDLYLRGMDEWITVAERVSLPLTRLPKIEADIAQILISY
jgi:hypothetical protein